MTYRIGKIIFGLAMVPVIIGFLLILFHLSTNLGSILLMLFGIVVGTEHSRKDDYAIIILLCILPYFIGITTLIW